MAGVRSTTDITQDQLKELLSYDPETGIFMWLESKQGRSLDRPAGDMQSGGRVISINGKRYQAARLAWLYVHGEMPIGYMQYRNRDVEDLRIDNLRYARTRQESNRLYREKYPDANRIQALKRYNGMTEADYMALYVAQGGVCATCKQPETATRGGKVRWLCVDHCHADGHVRGLLCVGCNTALGYAKDSPAILRALADYAEADERKQAEARTNVIPMKGTA